MIECTSEYIYKKKRHKKLWRFIVFVIVIVVASFSYNNFVVFKNINNICSDYLHSKGSEAITNAVIFSMAKEGDYEDIVSIQKNQNGDISLIYVSNIKTNQITRNIIRKTNAFMTDIIKEGVPIPLLAFFGINIISGYGYKIDYKLISIVTVNCNFRNEFISAGINQTRHSIYADVEVTYKTNYYLKKDKSSIVSSALLCESIIVGKVPEIYFSNNS